MSITVVNRPRGSQLQLIGHDVISKVKGLKEAEIWCTVLRDGECMAWNKLTAIKHRLTCSISAQCYHIGCCGYSDVIMTEATASLLSAIGWACDTCLKGARLTLN